MIFLFGGLGSIPQALNIIADHVLFLKVVLAEKVSFFVHMVFSSFF
jgi:hypothetical protein